MNDSQDVVAQRLTAAFDEADATLSWVEAAQGPAIVRLARLRLALAAAGFGCLAVAAMTSAAGGSPAEAASVSRVCRQATELLEDAIGPLAGRWRIDGVADQLSPEGLGIGTEPAGAAVIDQAMTRIGSIILRPSTYCSRSPRMNPSCRSCGRSGPRSWMCSTSSRARPS